MMLTQLPAPSDVTTKDYKTTTTDGAQLLLRWYAHRDASPGSAILYIPGGGVTAGKTDIRNGQGSFSKVSSINELFGSYGSASAGAAAGKAASATALTKGHVHLALSGTGKGVELGLALGRFTITRK